MYTGRIVLPFPSNLFTAPILTNLSTIPFVFPNPIFPRKNAMFRKLGEHPYLFQYSSIIKNTSHCAGLIANPFTCSSVKSVLLLVIARFMRIFLANFLGGNVSTLRGVGSDRRGNTLSGIADTSSGIVFMVGAARPRSAKGGGGTVGSSHEGMPDRLAGSGRVETLPSSIIWQASIIGRQVVICGNVTGRQVVTHQAGRRGNVTGIGRQFGQQAIGRIDNHRIIGIVV